MASFYDKYRVEAVSAAEFITLETSTDNLVDAHEAVEDSDEYKEAIEQEFNAPYDEVIDDCYRYLTTGTLEINSPFA